VRLAEDLNRAEELKRAEAEDADTHMCPGNYYLHRKLLLTLCPVMWTGHVYPPPHMTQE
jgi:hypothetical protein